MAARQSKWTLVMFLSVWRRALVYFRVECERRDCLIHLRQHNRGGVDARGDGANAIDFGYHSCEHAAATYGGAMNQLTYAVDNLSNVKVKC